MFCSQTNRVIARCDSNKHFNKHYLQGYLNKTLKMFHTELVEENWFYI